jgi:hypothetical protein
MEKGIEFSLTRPDEDALGRVELSDAILDVEPPDGFKPFKGEVFILPWEPKNISPRVRWRLTGAGVTVLEFPACGPSSGLSRFDVDLKVGSISSR